MARIYVASLSDYNAGNLHGVWINLDDHDTVEDVQAKVDLMLKETDQEYAEEWAIHDYEGFGGIKIGEYEPFDTVCKLAKLIEKFPAAAVSFAYDCTNDVDCVESYIDQNYCGEHDSEESFAEQYCDDMGDLNNIPNFIKYNINWEGVARDMFTYDYGYTQDEETGNIHVFRRC